MSTKTDISDMRTLPQRKRGKGGSSGGLFNVVVSHKTPAKDRNLAIKSLKTSSLANH